MGSVNPPKKRDYGDKTRIDMNQSYQVAYWKQRFGVSEEELGEAVRAAGALARQVEAYHLRMFGKPRWALSPLGRFIPCSQRHCSA
jgi:hypothetical protein